MLKILFLTLLPNQNTQRILIPTSKVQKIRAIPNLKDLYVGILQKKGFAPMAASVSLPMA